MSSEKFVPDDLVAVAGKVKYVGGNFLVVEFASTDPLTPMQDVIVFKNRAIRFRDNEGEIELEDNVFNKRFVCDKIISGGLIRPINPENNKPENYSLLQTFLTDEIRVVMENEEVIK